MQPGSWRDYDKLLADWAVRASSTRGRVHAEQEHPYRSPFQRDRDRIVHSAAFRRLANKTQVFTRLFVGYDYSRMRLTHTLEVAQIARSMARVLRLNEDLTEAIALVHDIGHTPFGHRGQDILHDLMRDYGGFEHNIQALRIVSVIESRYPDFPGLNLTYEVREAIAKHGRRQVEPLAKEFGDGQNPTLEAQIVNLADPIAYNAHDVDDGITAGTINQELLKECELWQEGREKVMSQYPDLTPKLLKYHVVRYIINEQVTDLLENTTKNLERLSPKSPADVRQADIQIADFSKKMWAKHTDLKKFLRQNMYDHYEVKRIEHKARQIITDLFTVFLKEPELLPPNVRVHYDSELKKGNEKRIVCDYIAGMTDIYAAEEHKKIYIADAKS